MEDKVLLAVVSVPILLVILSKLKSSLLKPKLNLPPGPSMLSVIRSLVNNSGIHSAMRVLAQKHGPVMMFRLGEVRAMVVSSPEAAQELMKTQDLTFADRYNNINTGALNINGDVIALMPYGEQWRQLRKICMLELLSAARVSSLRQIREVETSRFMESLAASAAAGTAVNLSTMISRFMNDTIVRESVGSRSKHQDDYLDALDTALRRTLGLNIADFFPSSRLMQILGTPRKVLACRERIERVLKQVIQETREAMDRGDDVAAGTGREGFVGVLLRLQKEGSMPIPLTDETIVALVFMMFAAGSETSTTTLNWCMTELIRSPAVMAKAQAEVREAFKGKSTITEADLEGLSYLKLVIKEALRTHTPLPLLLPRLCREPCQIMGYDIPKGTVVLVNAWAICRDPKYWDDDPEEFKPERFQNSSLDYKGTNYEFLPFGAGRRICPGINLGVANLELVFARLLYHFDWKLPHGIEPNDIDMREALGLAVRKKTSLILHPITRIPPASV